MKKSFSIALFLLCAAGPCLGQSGEGRILPTLDWLAGHWEGTFGGHFFETHYTSPDGGMILSVSKQIRRGRVSLFEMEQFVERAGEVVLTPYPFGKASRDLFRLVDYDSSIKKAKFVSPEHDFPTEISYELVSADRLRIVVAGLSGERRVEITADLKRVTGPPKKKMKME